MRIDILTLFPDMCRTVLEESILGRGSKNGFVSYHCHNIRDFAGNKHNRVDDTPYGGGCGMVMMAEPIFRCFEAICEEAGSKPHFIYMSPQGKTLTQGRALELSKVPHLCILCGHYEGVDQRVLDELIDEEVSIGDYVLTGGELPALVLTDCISRMVEGVLSSEECFTEESHFGGLLEHPQYTKPQLWRGRVVPEVLMSGHHANIAAWRREEALRVTREKRPELFTAYQKKQEI